MQQKMNKAIDTVHHVMSSPVVKTLRNFEQNRSQRFQNVSQRVKVSLKAADREARHVLVKELAEMTRVTQDLVELLLVHQEEVQEEEERHSE